MQKRLELVSRSVPVWVRFHEAHQEMFVEEVDLKNNRLFGWIMGEELQKEEEDSPWDYTLEFIDWKKMRPVWTRRWIKLGHETYYEKKYGKPSIITKPPLTLP